MEALQAELETSKAEANVLRAELARYKSGWQTLRVSTHLCDVEYTEWAPASENAQHSIFAISKDMAKKFAKNKNKEA